MVLEMNEVECKEAKKIFDTHQLYVEREKERFYEVCDGVDKIIDYCDRAMESTLH